MTPDDRKYMREALDLASRGRALASPNPMVGAVVLDAAGNRVGEGFHTYDGVKHGETLALEQAGQRARGGTLYVSLEPCTHQGRTPACTDGVLTAGIQRVVAPHEDANPAVSGKGFARLKDQGVEVELAAEFAAEAQKLNEAYIHHTRTRLPLVTLKAALTLDGKIAAPDDNSGWITSDIARLHVQQVRHDHDAILTGIGTVIADDCLLTDRTGLPRRRPLLRVVVDSLSRLSLESRLVESFANDLVVMTTSAAPAKRREALEARGVAVHVFDADRGRVDLEAVVRWLGEQQMLSLMIEAGAKLNWAALDAAVVDKILLYYAPKILGGVDSLPMVGGMGRRARAAAIRFSNLSTFPVAPDEFAVEAYLHKDGAAAPARP
jgi:diaminohydroxyphosphoribosylaminopyrimidine deaminase/5-amino-6-(5-phosphoribosylamino)uracil reductase